MDAVRKEILAKVDKVLSQALQTPQTSSSSQWKIEISLLEGGSSDDPPRKVLSDTIDLNRLQNTTYHVPKVCNPVVDSHSGNDTVPSRRATRRSQNAEPLAQDGPRRAIGGLRLGNSGSNLHLTPPRTPSPPTIRQLGGAERHFPKRRKLDTTSPPKLQQSTVDKLIEGIWEQIHKPKTLALGQELTSAMRSLADKLSVGINPSMSTDFSNASKCCLQMTSTSRTGRALEVMVQAHWVDCYDARLAALRNERPELRAHEHKKIVLTEACTFFSWSEKELRNRMSIWKGYREIKDVAGWSALVFAGPGIYRFCKYRLGFDQEALAKLQSIRLRAEVAADTHQPQWRELLSIVGQPTQLHWRGHPHDWVVSKRKDPIPLSVTYKQWDPTFSFTHIEESIVECEKWGDKDPRRSEEGPAFTCESCSKPQSKISEENECECFPDLFSPNPRTPCPVQVFRTDNGRNNGLIACCTFDRGVAVGEFVGVITKGLVDVDVMQSQVGTHETYQVWQGRYGNYTRFINHSCQPNCQFQTFFWLGIQRIIVVSKGVPAGKELTVDYSGRYWQHLDKICRCGEARCRYKDRDVNTT